MIHPLANILFELVLVGSIWAIVRTLKESNR